MLRGVQLQSTSAGQETVATDSRLAPQECAHYHPAPSSIAGNPKGRGPSVETIRTHARLFWHCMNQAARTLILNGFAGRSGEWQLMLRADVDTSFESGLDFLECPKHNTAIYYGELASRTA